MTTRLIEQVDLQAIIGAARVALDDLTSGLADGTYDEDCLDGHTSAEIEAAIARAEAAPMTANPNGPYSPELAAAFRIGAEELCNCNLGDRIVIGGDAQVEEGEGGAQVHCVLFVSDADRAALAGEECTHCGEERPAGPEGSLWTCGNCNGLNEAQAAA